jgi:exodeoxyribonuclease VII small subunit
MENEKEMTFEECITALENILKDLERQDISLEDSVKAYTKGLELSKKCNDILSANEKLVVDKMTESGLVDFNQE